MQTSDEVIKEQFRKLNQQFKYFTNNQSKADIEQHYIALLNFYNAHNGQQTDKSYEQAYKLLVMFGRKDLKTTLDALTRYTKNFNFRDKKNYLDEMVHFSLPTGTERLNLSAWRAIIMKKGPQAAKLFEHAALVHNELGYTPKTFAEIKKAIVQAHHACFQDNAELAELGEHQLITPPAGTSIVAMYEQIHMQEQAEVVKEPTTFSLTRFFAELWQGLNNTLNRLVHFISSPFSESADELAQTDVTPQVAVGGKNIECSYSRMAKDNSLDETIAEHHVITHRITTLESALSTSNVVEQDIQVVEPPRTRPII